MKNVYLLFVTLFCLSCTQQKNGCPYFDEISSYFKDELSVSFKNIEGEHLYYILDLQGCEPCTNLNTNMLSQLKENKKLTILFVGETGNEQFLNRIELLKKRFQNLGDKKLEIYNYQTNFAKPLLIHIKNGKCYNIIEVIDPKINEVKDYINSI